MPEQTPAPLPGQGRLAGSQRFIPPLPAGIPILPGQVIKAKRRVPVGLIVLLVIAALAGLIWFYVWYGDYDTNRIDPLVTRAMVAHVPKGTRLPITLRGGPRILQIGRADVTYKGITPTTCVYVTVLDPKTGAVDTKSQYVGLTCIEGLRYPIH
jgi:hypothetical protein